MGFITGLLTFLGVGATTAATIASVISWTVTLATITVGVKGYRQMKDMQAQGQVIMANKTSAGGKIPVIYGTRRVGAQISAPAAMASPKDENSLRAPASTTPS